MLLNSTKRVLRIKSGRNWKVGGNEKVSFLNFSSITAYFDNRVLDQVEYYCDGSLSSIVVSVLGLGKVKRFSFDFTSIAAPVFRNAEEKGIPLNIVGATDDEVVSFAAKIRDTYPGMKMGVVRNGYFGKQETPEIVESLVEIGGITILGLGAGKQEEVLIQLISRDFNGCCYTCGGFIRQESFSTRDYYPRLFDELNIRFLYRMYKEPHTIRRYFVEYPRNILFLTFLVLSKKVKIYID